MCDRLVKQMEVSDWLGLLLLSCDRLVKQLDVLCIHGKKDNRNKVFAKFRKLKRCVVANAFFLVSWIKRAGRLAAVLYSVGRHYGCESC